MAKIKFLGVAGGTVQLEDCMFDATDNTDADAVYTNAKIAGIIPFFYIGIWKYLGGFEKII